MEAQIQPESSSKAPLGQQVSVSTSARYNLYEQHAFIQCEFPYHAHM